ncbi:hypothetical protein A3A76_00140 [Candidatus Woesebacteria bacterium RIFCSPLOWO2_01_FULL_39_23]|uniref:protein O-GlcNAc transferase n=1 Tax=Candidatus Woesebacteria bacterium RIFCSPHIGHO2_01_FULL_40_22 TaxID=1802499 RepID=A0A1F7YGA1_9BACT|nr:MAG: hypothetical protein A2141_03000 [Candidatus Woesebacteria bacterium RBG_16_40_11]OGM26292.1 MAG: hypothetical protein A2628_03760 [Candidatus Woesebacteria bacterium RIFCSPHIGHO2_01_FULL_40_22]OGM62847.1 MAG: hypothetical protein A3A76_00140 [Candidatus Woesebacteria bacterium RIFCSPLOWO2_01_FULL_39_23]
MRTAEEYNNFAAGLSQKGDFIHALKYFQLALAINPNHQSILNNLGIVLNNLSRPYEALGYLQRAMLLDPPNAETHFLIGNIMHEHGFTDIALQRLKTAVKIDPRHAGALTNLGLIYKNMNRIREAVRYFRLAYQADPEHIKAYAYLLHCKRYLCDWRDYYQIASRLDALENKQIKIDRMPVEEPFISVTRTADSKRNFEITKIWAKDLNDRYGRLKDTFSVTNKNRKHHRIRLGYLSADFRDHATSHLILGLFRLHDKKKFSVNVYSYSDDDKSKYVERIKADSDKFVDLQKMSDYDCARQINDDEVDILVDLKGHTGNNRLRICTYRPAPIQITYLGFPGTTAAKFIDYMIADNIVVPGNAKYFTEKLIFLPNCYQINDNKQKISAIKFKRADFSLPENAFVYCYLGQSYKIEPDVFEAWMRILKTVPKSVIWLMAYDATSIKNLKKQAAKCGVRAGRLIFAGRLPKDEHLARLKLADLALDTVTCNGHTSTSDCLWAGLPLVTLEGKHFASRVAASILTAVGLPELITYSLEEYKDLAIELATNPEKLLQLRLKLKSNRLTYPLFDTPMFVKNLEKAYEIVWRRYLKGLKPAKMIVK